MRCGAVRSGACLFNFPCRVLRVEGISPRKRHRCRTANKHNNPRLTAGGGRPTHLSQPRSGKYRPCLNAQRTHSSTPPSWEHEEERLDPLTPPEIDIRFRSGCDFTAFVRSSHSSKLGIDKGANLFVYCYSCSPVAWRSIQLRISICTRQNNLSVHM